MKPVCAFLLLPLSLSSSFGEQNVPRELLPETIVPARLAPALAKFKAGIYSGNLRQLKE